MSKTQSVPTSTLVLDPKRVASSARSPYELVEAELLGKGPHATVYGGRCVSLQRSVAIKVFDPGTPNLQRRLLGARFSAQSIGANVVQVFDVDSERNWIVMEKLHRTIAEEMAKSTLPEQRVREVMKDLLYGLTHIHADDKLHYAITPTNVLVDVAGNAKLSDSLGFDFQDELIAPRQDAAYIAPEILNPGEFGMPGRHSDLFCLGLLSTELLMGRRFYQITGKRGRRPESLLNRIASTQEFPNLEEFLPTADGKLLVVLNKMLRKDVASRYGSADEVLADLSAVEPRTNGIAWDRGKTVVVTSIDEGNSDTKEKVLLTSAPDGSVDSGMFQVNPESRWHARLDALSDLFQSPKVIFAIASLFLVAVVVAGNRNQWESEPTPVALGNTELPRWSTATITVSPKDAQITFQPEIGKKHLDRKEGSQRTVIEIKKKQDADNEELVGEFRVFADDYHAQTCKFESGKGKYEVKLEKIRFARVNIVKPTLAIARKAQVLITCQTPAREPIRAEFQTSRHLFFKEIPHDFQPASIRVTLAGYQSKPKKITLKDLDDIIDLELEKVAKEPPFEVPEKPITRKWIDINSEPEGAEVYVDDETSPRGKTPLRITVDASRSVAIITLNKPGFATWRKRMGVYERWVPRLESLSGH